MSDNLETALRRAVGLEPTPATKAPQAGEPIALNDFDSLKAMVMNGIKQSAARETAGKTTNEALEMMTKAISGVGARTQDQAADAQFINAVNDINNR